jgi:hypothetical protein
MRPILEALGEEVEWDQETKTITISSYGGVLNDKDIDKTIMQIGSTKITNEYWMWDDNDYTYKNVLRNNKTMDVAPKVVNGHTMIPVRHIGAGRYVTWYGANRTIYLSLLPMQINGVTIQPEDTRYPEDLAQAEAAKKAEIARNMPYSNPDVPQWALDAVNNYLKENGLNGFAAGSYYDDEENIYSVDEYKGDTSFIQIGTFHVDKTTKKVTHIYVSGLYDNTNINDPYNPYNPNTKVPKEDRMKYIRYQEEHPEEYKSYLDELELERQKEYQERYNDFNGPEYSDDDDSDDYEPGAFQ